MKKINFLLILFIFFILLLPSLFDCEKFLFIRFFSLLILVFLIFWIKKKNIKKFDILSLLLLFNYLIILTINYLVSPNSHNIKLHTAEYISYFLILLIIANNKYKKQYLLYIANAIVLSSIIQFFYSIDQITKHINRISGNTPYPNFLSFLFLLSFISAIYLANYFRKQKKLLIIYIIIAFFNIILMFMTGSRNIFIFLPVSIFIILYFRFKNKAIVYSSILIILLLIIPTKSRNRLLFEKKTNPYGVQRLNIYKQCIKIAFPKLPFGVGFNNLKYHTLQKNFPVEGRIGRYNANAVIAHNEYIEWFVNAGIFGIFHWILIFLIFIYFIASDHVRENDDKYVFLILFMFYIFSLIDNALYLPYNAVIFFIFTGFALSKIRKIKTIDLEIVIYIILIFGLIVVLTDITGFVFSKYYFNKSKNSNVMNNIEKAREYSEIFYRISFLYNPAGNYNMKFMIDEMIYNKEKYASDFLAILNDMSIIIKEDRMNYKHYRKMARILRKYKSTILRKNTNTDELIKKYYDQAIYFNPYNPFLRYEYADYLLSINDTVLSINQLNIAIENEPYFLIAYKKLIELNCNEDIEKRFEKFMINYKKIKKKAITPYEKKLIEL